ncbi:bifunctional demethylmenaquinone methyltransferase/2-methoxy-6-polyprenyl-1,4-benzoquinol methylase UbiE [Minwuia sp.]|uniref:bifunctional demethylmenaquinone methyltransferase/2-methoxy-6-polyprenyl-1,4-benzoquinol methylase UbiE n=1 Tax=Minwuia sp. TaxID=2493630 RepID=UPI003A93FE6C
MVRSTMNDNPTDDQDERASFGFTEVPVDQKASLVGEVFSSVAGRYDLMNDLMSAGIHRLWKDRFVSALRPRPGERVLDLAGGTGDIAHRILKRTGGRAAVTLCDINPAMVEAGRDRLIDKGVMTGIDWTVGDAETLPFPDCSFDAATIAFGIRNVTRIPKALADIRRVLRPGGRFFCLEFSNVREALKPAYDLYSFQVLPRVGKVVAGDEDSYRYLAESIRQFPDRETFAGMISDAGFRRVSHEALSQGIAAIHRGWRI